MNQIKQIMILIAVLFAAFYALIMERMLVNANVPMMSIPYVMVHLPGVLVFLYAVYLAIWHEDS